MNSLKQIIGFLVILFIGIPTLFGIIWAVGLTRAAISPELLSDLPREVIEDVPRFVDDIFSEIERDRYFKDEAGREWILATREAGVSVEEVMEESGFLDWLHNELTASLEEIGKVLRGEIPYRPIILDLEPMKRALVHPSVEKAFYSVVEQLPSCDTDDLDSWRSASMELMEGYHHHDELPACNPGRDISEGVFASWRINVLKDIPDDVEIFQDVVEDLPYGLSISRTVISLTYLMFLIPAVFILGGALIAAGSKSAFFRWSGISTGIGGLLTLGSALLVKSALPFGLDNLPYQRWESMSWEMHSLVSEKSLQLVRAILDHLIDPVIAVAGTVAVVGLILFALSYTFTNHREPESGHSSAARAESKPGTESQEERGQSET